MVFEVGYMILFLDNEWWLYGCWCYNYSLREMLFWVYFIYHRKQIFNMNVYWGYWRQIIITRITESGIWIICLKDFFILDSEGPICRLSVCIYLELASNITSDLCFVYSCLYIFNSADNDVKNQYYVHYIDEEIEKYE